MDFYSISLFLVVAAVFGILAKFLKQPVLIGYLFAGLALAYLGLIHDTEGLEALGKIGIALLLFLVGLEMNVRELPTLGKVAMFTGLGQIIFTSILGFLISLLLGYGIIPSVYIAVALTFSSTIIIVKLLSEKGDLGSLYGKIAIGFLLVQDFVAILILMFLAGLKQGDVSVLQFVFIGVKALLLLGIVWFLSKKILPYIFNKFVATSPEVMFVGSIAWALGVSALVGGPLGFSFEIGGFLAGLALSNLPEHLNIANKTRPLRDFFLTIFFLVLGSQLLIQDIGSIIFPAIIFSLFILIGNPLIVLIIMGVMKYKKRTSFLASVTVAQISEFSFILMAMGYSLGHFGESEVAVVVLVGVVTMTASTYLILGADKIYSKIKKYLSVFERKNSREEILVSEADLDNHVVLVGGGRTGKSLITYLKKTRTPFIVVDYNPKVFSNLAAEKISVILGDVDDSDVLDLARIEKSRLVISAAPNIHDNLVLLEYVKNLKTRPLVIVKAGTREEALKLYEAGASYVLLPEIIAGEYLRHIFVSHGLGEARIKRMGKGHFNRLVYQINS